MMKWSRILLAGCVFSISCLFLTPLPAQETTWVPIQGNVRLADGTPICAMVLANGQYMFSCDGAGAYDLDVPLDTNGQITLFSFADGFAPYSITTDAFGFPREVVMQTADPDSPLIETSPGGSYCVGERSLRIKGNVKSDTESYRDSQELCAMVLINGQQMFSCGTNLGRYDLVIPLDETGQITTFVFADGFQPYSDTYTTKCNVITATADGVEFVAQLVDVGFGQFAGFGQKRCELLGIGTNTTSTPKTCILEINAFDFSGGFLGETSVSLKLPPGVTDSSRSPIPSVSISCDRSVGSWELKVHYSPNPLRNPRCRDGY